MRVIIMEAEDAFIRTLEKSRDELLGRAITNSMPLKTSIVSSLGLYILTWLAIFEGVALFWYILFHFDVIPHDHQNVSPTAFNLLGVVLGFIFALWAQSWLRRFSERADQYLHALGFIETMASHVATALKPKGSDSEEESARKQMISVRIMGSKPHTERVSMIRIIHEIRVLLLVLARAVTYLFLNDPHMGHPIYHSMEALSLPASLVVELQGRSRVYSSHRGTLLNKELNVIHRILDMIDQRLSTLQDAGAITETAQSSINEKEIAKLREHLGFVWRHRVLRSYEYYRTYIVISLCIVFVFFPVFLWRPYGALIFVIYPMMMFILSGSVLISRWLGDPFEGDNVYTRFDYELYHARTRVDVDVAFEVHYPMGDLVSSARFR